MNAPVPDKSRVAQLPPADLDVEKLPEVLALGYGQSDDRHNAEDSGAGTLRYTTFKSGEFGVLPEDSRVPVAFQNLIMAIAERTSVCHGDSGGPLMAKNTEGSTNMIVGINDAVMPHYEGQQQIDYATAAAAHDLQPFYDKYPDARGCLGGKNVFVQVAPQVPWIIATVNDLIDKAIANAKAAKPADAPAQTVVTK